MPTCSECKHFSQITEEYPDYEPDKGDCVRELQDSKGKWWSAKVVMGSMDASECPDFKPRT
jgi:benzylsuccinate synthase/naphthyl-2-methylsuccinate synthase gamma subunit